MYYVKESDCDDKVNSESQKAISTKTKIVQHFEAELQPGWSPSPKK